MMRERNRKDGLDHRTLEIRRVTRVVEGGKRFSFRSVVVVGDGKGRVGVGVAKGGDVAGAVEKAVARGTRELLGVPLTAVGSIPHEVRAKYGSARVLLKPAGEGKGIVAGGAVRAICALVGIRNITAKLLGSANKINAARATMQALARLKKPLPAGRLASPTANRQLAVGGSQAGEGAGVQEEPASVSGEIKIGQ